MTIWIHDRVNFVSSKATSPGNRLKLKSKSNIKTESQRASEGGREGGNRPTDTQTERLIDTKGGGEIEREREQEREREREKQKRQTDVEIKRGRRGRERERER